MEIVNLVVLNLEKVGIGVVLFLGAYLANMGLGAWKNVKIEGYDFDWKLIAKSGAKFLIMGVSLTILSVVISIVPSYVTFVGVEIAPETLETFDAIVIIGAFLTATIRYIGDSINKIKQILGIGSEG